MLIVLHVRITDIFEPLCTSQFSNTYMYMYIITCALPCVMGSSFKSSFFGSTTLHEMKHIHEVHVHVLVSGDRVHSQGMACCGRGSIYRRRRGESSSDTVPELIPESSTIKWEEN